MDDLYCKIRNALDQLDADIVKPNERDFSGVATTHMIAVWKARDAILEALNERVTSEPVA